MSTDLTIIPTTNDLALAGNVANDYASLNVFSDYQSQIAHNTQRAQRADLARFCTFLACAGVVRDAEILIQDAASWQGMTHGLLKGFMQWQIETSYSVASINRALATLHVYCSLAYQAHAISEDEHDRILLVHGYGRKKAINLDAQRAAQGTATRNGAKRSKGVTLAADAVIKLKRNHPQNTLQGCAAAAMFCLMLDHGLRVGEVAGLNVANIDLTVGEMIFYREKVKLEEQRHRFTEDTLLALSRYLHMLTEKYGVSAQAGPLFYGYQSRRISTRAINKLVGICGKSLGVYGLTPHALRHSWATRAARAKSPVDAMIAAGGWKSAAMVLRYVDRAEVANEGIVLE